MFSDCVNLLSLKKIGENKDEKNTRNVLFIMFLAAVLTLTGCSKSSVEEQISEDQRLSQNRCLQQK